MEKFFVLVSSLTSSDKLYLTWISLESWARKIDRMLWVDCCQQNKQATERKKEKKGTLNDDRLSAHSFESGAAVVLS